MSRSASTPGPVPDDGRDDGCTDERPLRCADAATWQAWLERHHQTAAEVWLGIASRGCPEPSITHAEALDTAICFGWIDALKRGTLPSGFWRQRFVPRTPRSKWSQINCARALELIDAGRMRPAGLAQVHAAQADGRWDAAYAPQSRITVPEDFAAALATEPDAAAFFSTLTGSTRYAFLYRLHNVTRPDARAQRIAMYLERLRAGRTLDD
jgi:uncharacterized protein YdeI (YjbR/CyaY-like superfamily)